MPRDHVYAQYLTVRDGDLPVPPPPTSVSERLLLDALECTRDRVRVLRRRHDELVAFADEVTLLPDGATGPTTVANLVGRLRSLRGALDDRLDRLPLDRDPRLEVTLADVSSSHPSGEPTVEAQDAAYTGYVSPYPVLGTPNPDEATRRLRLRVSLGWEPDGGEVRLGVDAEDADGTPVDLGGHHVALNRAALDRLVSLADVAAEVAWPVPADDVP